VLMGAWMVRAGVRDREAGIAIESSAIVIGWTELGDIGRFSTPDEIAHALRLAYPDRDQRWTTRVRNEIRSFLNSIQNGDLVVLPQPHGRFALGRVAGSYQIRPELPFDAQHTRPVTWLRGLSGKSGSAVRRRS
jgi:predicted Mrr-cat superfamily restriction endonuclease